MLEFVGHRVRALESHQNAVKAVTRPITKTTVLGTATTIPPFESPCELPVLTLV
jgi:hypothetical protein